MLSFLSNLVTLLLSLVAFVVNLLQSFVRLIIALFQFVGYAVVAFGYIPSELLAFVTVSLSVSVLLFLIRR